jgi:hypothetical protein
MRTKFKKKTLSEREIDRIVIAQADDDSAWEKPIKVLKAKPTTMRLSSELAARAAFFARLHRETRVEDWLKRIIQERIDFEENAFTGLKRDLTRRRAVANKT